MKMCGAEREKSFCSFWWNHIYSSWSLPMFRLTVTLDLKYWTGCDWFWSYLAKIKVFWKYWAYDTIEKTWLNHKKLWRVSDGHFQRVLLFSWLNLYRLSAKRSAYFRNHLLNVEERWKEKQIFFLLRHLRVIKWYTNKNFTVKYPSKWILHKLSLEQQCFEQYWAVCG